MDFFRDFDLAGLYMDLQTAIQAWAYDFLRTNGQIEE